MKQVQLLVTVEIDDDTDPSLLEGLTYIEFSGNRDGWADLEREVGEPDETSVLNDGPLAKLIDAKVVEEVEG